MAPLKMQEKSNLTLFSFSKTKGDFVPSSSSSDELALTK